MSDDPIAYGLGWCECPKTHDEALEALATLRADLARVTGHYTTLSNQIEAMPDCPDCFGHGTESCLTSSGEADECACGTCNGLGQVPVSVIKLRESLVRVTLERGDAQALVEEQRVLLLTMRDERDAARAQVRELQKVARHAADMKRADADYDHKRSAAAVLLMFEAVDALPPSTLEEPSDG